VSPRLRLIRADAPSELCRRYESQRTSGVVARVCAITVLALVAIAWLSGAF